MLQSTQTTVCLLTLVAMVRGAAQKPLFCMRYKFDDSSMLDEEDFDEYSSSGYSESSTAQVAVNTTQGTNMDTVPRPMKCAPDFNFCFTLWTQLANGTNQNISSQGCWKESTDHNVTCVQTECVASNRNDSLLYCCCSGDLCNKNMSVARPVILTGNSKEAAAAAAAISRMHRKSEQSTSVIFYIVISSIFALAFVLSVLYATSSYMRKRDKPEPEEAPLAPSGPGYSSNLRNVDNLKCLDMIGQGKYGVVYKGMIHEQMVAIKNFPEVHKQYYLNEREIYSLPLMESPALLTYFGYDERPTIDGKPQFLLLLSLAPLGCLQDWLIGNTFTFDIFCTMVKSITRGVSHLHTELQRGDLYKPCIVHRDLNTRNILVNRDLSCCIGDFGFALKVFGSKYEYKGDLALAETKSINEVGTIRYMAPELLEGAVNLRDCETSLKQMDVYALGLVLWEVATRCTDFYAPSQITPSYKAPYELEVGSRPSFEQMQVLVARHKARPLFPVGWGGGAAEKLVKDTCEDCWDHDAEARLTSLCAEERMQEVEHLRPRAYLLSQGPSPRLNTNNLALDQQVMLHQPQHHQQQAQNGRNISPTASSFEAPSTTVIPPPNQQILPSMSPYGNALGLNSNSSGPQPEKNHLMHPQQQLQPYQGRNPCQERNLAPLSTRPPQVLVEKSKKHSFQSGQENSLSCLEDDVSVEELIAGNSKKFIALTQNGGSNMGQGFPKQQNTEKKLRGWHGVRALIQKKLFRKDGTSDTAYGDEKSNLVDNRYANVAKGMNHSAISPTKDTTVNFIGDRQRSHQRSCSVTTTGTVTTTTTATPPPTSTVSTPVTTPTDGMVLNKRPNNLELIGSATSREVSLPVSPDLSRSNVIRKTFESVTSDTSEYRPLAAQSINMRISTPSRVVPRSLSASLSKGSSNNNNNNNNNGSIPEAPFKNLAPMRTLKTAARPISAEKHFRRQRSLEVFNEVFSGRGSTDKLRNPSQRVKTPGDVPPSVRKVRASKTLSLYDDRMMDPTTMNIL